MSAKKTITYAVVGSMMLLSFRFNVIQVREHLPSLSQNTSATHALTEISQLQGATKNQTIRSTSRNEHDYFRSNEATLHTCRINGRNHTVTIPTAPSFIIIGAQKSGTSFLVRHLNMHPNIVPSERKEHHYFDIRGLGSRAAIDEHHFCWLRQKYVQKYYRANLAARIKNSTAKLMTFDKTPSYFHAKKAPDIVYNTCVWPVKLVAMLRNPVDRAYSQHWMSFRKLKFETVLNEEITYMHQAGLTDIPLFHGNESNITVDLKNKSNAEFDQAFLDSIQQLAPYKPVLLHKGIYAPQLRHWMKRFPHPDPLLVLNYDDIKRDTKAAFDRILEHVGLPPYDPPDGFKQVFVGRYQQPMANSTRRRLEEFFEPFNAELADLLGEEWRGVWAPSVKQ